ncbi:MAG: hypothetical protein DRI46_11875, partial [Chloroflexi bacterium]
HKVKLLQDCSEIAALPGVQRRSARNDRLVVPAALSCHCEEPDRRGGDEAIQPFNSGFPSFDIKSNYCRIAVRLPRSPALHAGPLAMTDWLSRLPFSVIARSVTE